MSDSTPERVNPSTTRPLPIVGRPWFWVLFVGALWMVPLVKSLTAEFPPPLPGYDGEPLVFALNEAEGRLVSIQDLAGYLLILSELPLADSKAADDAIRTWREIKGRLRGLGSAVVYVQIAHGGGASQLTELIEAKHARKPGNVFLLDPSGSALDDLRQSNTLSDGDYFLLDTHGRWRGSYPGTAAGVDQLVTDAGQLANWPGQDPEIGGSIPR